MERVHLVLSAGGVRCLAYIGALERLAATYEYETVSTCSAGTFVGALLCAGVQPAEMRRRVLDLDLPRLAGDVRFKPLRQITRRIRYPFSLYDVPGIHQVFENIVGSDKMLGELRPQMATAALEVSSGRLVAYSSATHPDMLVSEVLQIATAVPLMYRPHGLDHGLEIVDAAMTSFTPLWLATGLGDHRRVVVLRVPQRDGRPPRNRFDRWLAGVVETGIASQDAYVLARTQRVTVHDIVLPHSVDAVHLDRREKQELVRAGWDAVAEAEELREEQARAERGRPWNAREEAALEARRRARDGRDGLALLDGIWRQRAHVSDDDSDPPVAFISYARKDRRYVERLRRALSDLIESDEVSVWDDSYIPVTVPWEDTLIDAIQRTRVAILLVSYNFLESDYIRSVELPLLRRQSARIVWVSLDGALPESQEQRWQGFSARDDDVDGRLEAAARAVRALFFQARSHA
jgi:predicted acylesterase/phospholipase RssA